MGKILLNYRGGGGTLSHVCFALLIGKQKCLTPPPHKIKMYFTPVLSGLRLVVEELPIILKFAEEKFL